MIRNRRHNSVLCTAMFRIIGASSILFFAAVAFISAHGAPPGAGGVPAMEERISDLEAVLGGPPQTDFEVHCAEGDTINEALQDATPAASVTITVQGVCVEDVVIERDDVTIQGSDPAPADGVEGSVTLLGAGRISLKDLIVRDSASIGVTAFNNSSVNLDNLAVSGHSSAGVFVLQNSSAVITDTNITNPAGGDNALALSDGGHARVSDSTFVSHNGEIDNGAAIGLFRSAHARLDGDNTITNTALGSGGPDEALALQALHTSEVRIQNGNNVINGNMIAFSNTNVDLRGVNVTGRVDIGAHSRMLLRETTVTGNVFLALDGLLDTVVAPDVIVAASIVSGDINCSNSQSLVNDANLSAGSISATCTIE